MVRYLDTSAFLKLITDEPESTAMRDWYRSTSHEPVWSSHLLRTEALRAGMHLGLKSGVVEDALDTVTMVLPGTATFRVAGHLEPAGLRSLDALHLATALELGDDLAGLVTYDAHMTNAARTLGIEVLAPA